VQPSLRKLKKIVVQDDLGPTCPVVSLDAITLGYAREPSPVSIART
jgi:hypothetical protein